MSSDPLSSFEAGFHPAHTPLFSPDERQELATPFPDRIIRAIRGHKIEEAVRLCVEMGQSQVVLHDFFADSCTVLWSWIGENLGENSWEPMFR